ncbi:GxxExxY protein [Chryseobacterium taichungense]|nr:GxxExxY protein [Chryseobacterium taichungense]
MPVIYDEKKFDLNFRIDILVENKVILELKSVKSIEVFIASNCRLI